MRKTLLAVFVVIAVMGAGRAEEVTLRDALVIGPIDRQGRTALHVDVIESQIVYGTFAMPAEGDRVSLASGAAATWQSVHAGDDGWIRHVALNNGYAAIKVVSEHERVAMLQASGHSLVYVNGEPRVGDPYQYGIVSVPVALRTGDNLLLFRCARGGALTAKLLEPPMDVFLDARDATLPDLIIGESRELFGALLVMNATRDVQESLGLRVAGAISSMPPLVPLSLSKVAFSMRLKAPADEGAQTVTVELGRLRDQAFGPLHSAELSLAIKTSVQVHKRTFVSGFDGSVQYYALNPCTAAPGGERPALVLSLHGAGVEATGQAAAYSGKSWAHIVAPTNRRPYGFDWEDWGRLDALEVLDIAARELGTDPTRVYLTGHSMGGHGTWQIGVLQSDRFAALGASAGWASFRSYGGVARNERSAPEDEILARANGASDTEALLTNCGQLGVYILHGDADDNVPVSEARALKQRLDVFHHDVVLFEQPGAGHWWDVSPEPGADCVDWAPMFDMFARHRLPAQVLAVDFKTTNPGISSRCHWLTVETQVEPLVASSVRATCEPRLGHFAITTENVAGLRVDALELVRPGVVRFDIDGDTVETTLSEGNSIHLERAPGHWQSSAAPPPMMKRPERYGPLKQVFQNRALLVYGTHGTAAENAWALAKARFDAETFWYRGNGTLEVMADTRFDARRDPDRNVILYGNTATNLAWASLLAEMPTQIRPGEVAVGEVLHRGEDLACVAIYPRPDSNLGLVGAVAGSSITGMRLTDRMSYFTSGVGYPDWLVISSRCLVQPGEGVVALGILRSDWSLP